LDEPNATSIALAQQPVSASSDTTLQLTLPARSPKPHTLFEDAKHTELRSPGSHDRGPFKKLIFASLQVEKTKKEINLSLKEETLILFF
jgi:hypothetical protein